MHGASHLKRNIRRTGIPATVNGQPNPEYGPTAERLRHSGGGFVVGGEDRGVRTYVMRDTPLDKALRKGIITGAQHSALEKLRHHWFHGGTAPMMTTLDLDRVFSSDPGSAAGMPKSEQQAFHRARYREAVGEIGLRASYVVEGVAHDVCADAPVLSTNYETAPRVSQVVQYVHAAVDANAAKTTPFDSFKVSKQ